MILDQIKQIIPKEFYVKDFLDLSKLDTNAKLFQALVTLKEDEFNNNTRIIFYHSTQLIYTYTDLPADSLIQLQKMLVYIDIPNFFCLIISNQNIEDELLYVSKHYAVNEKPIEFICLK